MTDSDITQTAHRFYERISVGDALGAAELIGDDYVGHGLGAGGGADSVLADLVTWLAAVPDLRISVRRMVSEGDLVAVRTTMRGTQLGDFAGIPASGRRFAIAAADVLRVVDGRIVEAWTLCDLASMFVQLGALPVHGRARLGPGRTAPAPDARRGAPPVGGGTSMRSGSR